uniref:Uncharacterized protein n=1 Tax=Mimivirus LCMiAC01 TaxID=2506608 RepID=A0A481Z0C9_9VIRU|nr:MAG: hypothetical protein LCMiAC01_02120 [Mimivirus LCMiAC01]
MHIQVHIGSLNLIPHLENQDLGIRDVQSLKLAVKQLLQLQRALERLYQVRTVPLKYPNRYIPDATFLLLPTGL